MSNIRRIPLSRTLFLDIETVPQNKNFNDLSENMKTLWGKKRLALRAEDKTDEEFYERAGIYAEFGKIICISVGIVIENEQDKSIRMKTFFGEEKELLTEFAELLNTKYNLPEHTFLCGHNIKEFDVPYICRRMLVNGIDLPNILNIHGKKPWEVNFLDTLELWKFGDYKHYTSLDLLAAVFNIPTPKDDIDGSMVGKVFWEENDIDRIIKYCEKDVITTINLYLRLRNEKIIDHNKVIKA